MAKYMHWNGDRKRGHGVNRRYKNGEEQERKKKNSLSGQDQRMV